MASRSSELLFEEQSPINSLAMGESTSELWCATTDSTVRCGLSELCSTFICKEKSIIGRR